MEEDNRRLAAILAADVVGYSALVGSDESGTLTRVRALRTEVIEPHVATHGGRIFKTTGDGFFGAFASAVQALRCAIAIQDALRTQSDSLRLRIGVHQGEVVPDGDDLMGDGVIIAARLEPLAEPGGIAMSARVREDAAGKILLDVEDLGETALKNIARKVRVFRVRMASESRPVLALPDMPSLAVLPFTNMGGDPEQEYFADGIVEDIITALSRVGWFFVIARNSSFTYKGRATDIKQVGRELGVRYVLEGSVRKAGGRVRITCQLIEAATGYHVWADRFDGDLADIFQLQDRITESVVGAVEPSLQMAEIKRSGAKPTESLDAYDLCLRALPHLYAFTRSGLDTAVALLCRSLEIDPAYARAKGFLAWVYVSRHSRAWSEPGEREAALNLARETVASADPEALRCAAHALSYFAGDHPAAFTALHRAVLLHPNSAQVLNSLGWVHCIADDPEPAIGYLERAMRLSPLDPEIGLMLSGLGIAQLLAGRSAQALPPLQRAVQETPTDLTAHRHLILALVRLGQLDEARAAAARLLMIRPDFCVGHSATQLSNREYAAELRLALLTAGLPE
jgi:adenylate cyclase